MTEDKCQQTKLDAVPFDLQRRGTGAIGRIYLHGKQHRKWMKSSARHQSQDKEGPRCIQHAETSVKVT